MQFAKDILKSNHFLNAALQTALLRAAPKMPMHAGNLRRVSRNDLISWMSGADTAYQNALLRFESLNILEAKHAANLGDRRALFQLVHFLAPRSILEIGTCNGASTLFMAAALHARHSDDTHWPRLTTVDIVDVNDPNKGYWRNSGLPFSPAEMLARVGLDHLVDFETAESDTYLQSSDSRFDFVFIDGSHRAKTVYSDIAGVLHHASPDALVLLHDYYPNGKALWPGERIIPGVVLGAKRAMHEAPDLEVIPLRELPWPTKAGGRKTSLAFLSRHQPSAGDNPRERSDW